MSRLENIRKAPNMFERTRRRIVDSLGSGLQITALDALDWKRAAAHVFPAGSSFLFVPAYGLSELINSPCGEVETPEIDL